MASMRSAPYVCCHKKSEGAEFETGREGGGMGPAKKKLRGARSPFNKAQSFKAQSFPQEKAQK